VYTFISGFHAALCWSCGYTGGKTVTKLVTPDEKQSMLFKLVSFITGWKNSLKGEGAHVLAAYKQSMSNSTILSQVGTFHGRLSRSRCACPLTLDLSTCVCCLRNISPVQVLATLLDRQP